MLNNNVVVIHVSKYLDGKDRLCNHNCLFCMEQMEPNNSDGVLPSLEDINYQLTLFHKQKGNIDLIYVAGGEPTMRKDFSEILKLAKQYSNDVILSTNCNYVDFECIYKTIKYYGIKKIATSIHGSNHLIHDRLTSFQGSFNNTISNMQKYLAAGMIITVNSVICSENILDMPKIARMFKKWKMPISKLTFTHFIFHGNAYYNKQLLYDIDKYSYLITSIIDASPILPYPITFRNFPLCLDERLEKYSENTDNINILKKNFKDIFINNEKAPKILKTQCLSCNLLKKCSGYLLANYKEAFD